MPLTTQYKPPTPLPLSETNSYAPWPYPLTQVLPLAISERNNLVNQCFNRLFDGEENCCMNSCFPIYYANGIGASFVMTES